MTDDKFIKFAAGRYERRMSNGINLIAQRITTGWHGFVSGPHGAKTLENGQHYLEATTLRSVCASLEIAAAKFTA